MTALQRYREVLRAPGVRRLLAAAILARMPIGLDSLAIVLFVQDLTGSFGDAGLVAGAFGVALGVSTPLQGRLVDRRGHAPVLLPLAAGHALALGALLGLGLAGAPVGVLVLLGALAGATLPPIGAVIRPLLPGLMRGHEDLLATAYALDSVVIELVFVAGPLLAAALVSMLSPGWALGAAMLLVLAGTATLVATPASRGFITTPRDEEAHVLGALTARPVRTIVLTTLPVGVCLGATEVALPAFATDEGSRGAAGVLLAVWSIGSAAGGLAYGARSGGGPLWRTYVTLALALPLCIAPLLAAPSILAMLPLALVAGIGIAPLFSAGNQLLAELAPAGVRTEAFSWGVTAIALGVAGGNALSGLLIDAAGWREAVGAAIAASVAGGAMAVAMRATLQRQPVA